MDKDVMLVASLALLALAAMIGIFKTKTAGWGKYSGSLLIICLALFMSAILFSAGKLEGAIFVNVLFAVIGFAGGLVTGKEK